MSFPNMHEARKGYLDTLLTKHGTLNLPISIDEQPVPLQTIFQPLMLRHSPTTIQSPEGEQPASEFEEDDEEATPRDPVIFAKNGAEALALSTLQRMIILGGPGMGKTTLLKDLLQQAIHQAQNDTTAPLPIFVSLPDLARSGLQLTDYLTNSGREDVANFTSTLVKDLHEGKTFLCLDSLDEVLPTLRPGIIALINHEALRCGGTWIIGSRFTEYKGGQFANSQFAEWELQPLNRNTRLNMVEHLLSALMQMLHSEYEHKPASVQKTAEMFIEVLERDTHSAMWGKNPLLLTMATIVYVRLGILPASRATLYREMVTIMLNMRSSEQQQRTELQHVLAEVALQLYQTRGRNFTVHELLDLLITHNPDTYQVNLAMRVRILDAGVLDVIAYQTYGFKHQMLQEYLSAAALAQQLCSSDATVSTAAWEFAWQKHTYSRWQEVLRLMVGVLVQEYGTKGTTIAVHWLQTLIDERKTPTGDIGDLCLVLALSTLRELADSLHISTVVEMAKKLLVIWVEQMLVAWQAVHVSRFERLRLLIEDIRALDLQIVLPALIFLEQTDKSAYQWTPELTGTPEDLLEALSKNIPAKVLIAAFGEHSTISLQAISELSSLRGRVSLEPLILLLENQQERWPARVAVAKILGRTGEKAALTALITTLQNVQTYYQIRIAIVETLGELPAEIPIQVLVDALRDQDERIRVAAAEACGNLGAHMPVTALIAAFHDSRNVRRVAVNALQKLPENTTTKPLLVALKDRDFVVRINAVKVLGHFGARAPVADLLALLSDKNIDVRVAVLKTLGLLRQNAPVEPLLRALYDESGQLREQALDSLNQLRKSIPRAILLKLLHDEHDAIQQKALIGARYSHEQLPVELLLMRLRTSESNTNSTVIGQLLTRMQADAPVAELIEIIRTGSLLARQTASEVLLRLYKYVPIEPIQALLQEVPGSIIAMNLVQLLIRREVAIPTDTLLALLQFSSYAEEEKYEKTIALLSRTGRDAPIAALLEMLFDTTAGDATCNHAAQVLNVLCEWISPEQLVSTASLRSEDKGVAMSILSILGEQAPIELFVKRMEDPLENYWVRFTAMRALNDVEQVIPLTYLVLGMDWCIHGIDDLMHQSMIRLGEQAPMEDLVALLGHKNNWTQRSATYSLQQLAPYVPLELIMAALDDNNPLMREGAAKVSKSLGERAPIAKLIEIARNADEQVSVRSATIRTLGKLKVGIPVEIFLDATRNSDFNLRSAGLMALEQLGKDAPLEVVTSWLKNTELSTEAIYIIGGMAENAPIELLIPFLDSHQKNVSAYTLRAIGRLGKYAPIADLVEHLYDNYGDMREDIIEALGELGQYAPLEIIFQALDSQNERAKHAAETRLNTLAEAMPAKFFALTKDDTRPMIRQAMLRAWAMLGKNGPIETALTALEDQSMYTNALLALESSLEYGRDEQQVLAKLPLNQLIDSLQSDSEGRIVTVRMLGRYAREVSAEVYLPLLGDSDDFICQEAVRVLHQIFPEVFQKAIVQAEAMLQGEPTGALFASRVQSRLAEGVAMIGCATPEVLTMLVDLLDWPYWEVRVKAAQALGALHRNIPDRAIRRLLELRNPAEPQAVRKAADDALTEILSRENSIEDDV